MSRRKLSPASAASRNTSCRPRWSRHSDRVRPTIGEIPRAINGFASQIRFAPDSPLEEAGFEPMVPATSAPFEGFYGRAGDPSSEGYGSWGLSPPRSRASQPANFLASISRSGPSSWQRALQQEGASGCKKPARALRARWMPASQDPSEKWPGRVEVPGYLPEREIMHCGTDGSQTRRWRGVDSNHQYRATRQRFREGVISAPLDSPPTERQHEREPTPWRCRGPCAVLMVRIRLAPPASLRTIGPAHQLSA